MIDFKSPLVWGGIAAAGLVLVLFSRSKGGGGNLQSSAVTLQAADAANVQLSGLALQGHIADLQANTAIDISANQSSASLMGQAFAYLANGNNNTASIINQGNSIKAAIAINQNNNDAARFVAGSADATRINIATTQAQNNVDLATIGAQAGIQMQSLKNALGNLFYGTQVQLAQINASSALAIGTQVQVPIAGIQAGAAQNIASTNANAAQGIAVTRANAATNIASTQADAAIWRQLISSVGGVASSAVGGGIGGSSSTVVPAGNSVDAGTWDVPA